MIHAVVLLIVLVAAAPLAAYIPMPVLAAILFVVAYNMGEWHEIPKLLKLTKTDISVWLVTFALTVFADLTIAVEVGMILAALLFIRKVSVTSTVSMVTDDYIEAGRAHSLQDKIIPSYVAIFRIHGPFLFGSTDKLHDIAAQADSLPPVVILRVRVMELPASEPRRGELFRQLLEYNARDLVHGSYGLEGDHVVLTDTLELENLDFSEFEASVDSLQLALASHLGSLAAFRER